MGIVFAIRFGVYKSVEPYVGTNQAAAKGFDPLTEILELNRSGRTPKGSFGSKPLYI